MNQRTSWKSVLGEILLIIISILIALQIDNWNTYRQERKFEKKALAEIKEAVLSDFSFHLERRKNRATEIRRAGHIVLDYLDGEMEYSEEVENAFWRLNWLMIFDLKTIPFESLRAKGLDLVQEDALRTELIRIYDFEYPKVQFHIEDFNSWTNNRVEPYCLQHFHIRTGPIGKYYVPMDKELLRQDPYFRNLVKEKISITRTVLSHIRYLQKDLADLLNLLEGKSIADTKYLFYLHGRIIEDQGIYARSERFGAYDYYGIIEALQKAGFRVLSEHRPRNTDINDYAAQLTEQINSLLARGVPPENISLLGFSKGSVIAMRTATLLEQTKINVVLMANCNDWILEHFDIQLHGRVLSIYEASDDVGGGTCQSFYEIAKETVSEYQEIGLNTGLNHGFGFQPLEEWLLPAIDWANN